MNTKDQTVQYLQLKETPQETQDQITFKEYNPQQTRQREKVKEFNMLTAKNK